RAAAAERTGDHDRRGSARRRGLPHHRPSAHHPGTTAVRPGRTRPRPTGHRPVLRRHMDTVQPRSRTGEARRLLHARRRPGYAAPPARRFHTAARSAGTRRQGGRRRPVRPAARPDRRHPREHGDRERRGNRGQVIVKIIPMALAALLLPLLPPASPSHTTECATEASVDFDGDGVDDVVAGGPFAAVDGLPGAGAVHVVSGRRTTMIGAPRPAGGDGFGWSVAVARLDDDACADLVVGAPYADVDGKTDAGAVYLLYGGAERDVRVVAPDPQEGAHFGWSVAATPDDGGVVAIGAPHEDDDGVRDAGAVYLLRADDPDTLTRISQESKGLIGNSETG